MKSEHTGIELTIWHKPQSYQCSPWMQEQLDREALLDILKRADEAMVGNLKKAISSGGLPNDVIFPITNVENFVGLLYTAETTRPESPVMAYLSVQRENSAYVRMTSLCTGTLEELLAFFEKDFYKEYREDVADTYLMLVDAWYSNED